MGHRRWLERLALVSLVAACGLSSRAGKNRCGTDRDCVAPRRCYEGICRLPSADCEGENCAGNDGENGGCGAGACGGTPNGGTGSGSTTGGMTGGRTGGSGGDPGGNGGEDSGGSRASGGAGGAGRAGSAPEAGGGGAGASAGAGAGAGAGGSAATAGSAGAGGSGGCSHPLGWTDVELLPVPTRGVRASTLSRGLALVGTSNDCPGLLFVGQALVTPNCATTTADPVVFDKERSAGRAKPTVDNEVIAMGELGDRHQIPVIQNVSHVDRPPAPWAARSPLPGETLTAVSYAIDGFARAATLSIPPETFEALDSPESFAPRAAIFGSDGKFLGFCRIDACGTASSCISMRSLVHESSTLPEHLGIAGVHWGDVTGEGASDAVAINLGYIGVAASTASSLGTASFWLFEGYRGRLDTLLGDLDGDGRSDLVKLDPGGVSARTSTGSGFRPSSGWTSDTFDTHGRVALANVDGLPGDDLVGVIQGEIRVWRSNGTAFESSEVWATVPSGFERGWFSDVTHDGCADAVFAVGNDLVVLRSTAEAFDEAEVWLTGESAEAPGWFIADVSGDGMADAVAIDAAGARLFLSNGTAFGSVGPLTIEPTVGERDTSIADVNGDEKADVITHHHESILAFLSTGTDFAAPVLWHDGFYAGGI